MHMCYRVCNLICSQPVNTGPSLIRSPAWSGHTVLLQTCEQPTDDNIVAAVMAPAEPASAAPSDEEEEEGDSTSLDLPRRPQAMEALDTLQGYLLGVSNSDRAQMSLLSVEQFLTLKGPCTTQMTLDNFLRKQ